MELLRVCGYGHATTAVLSVVLTPSVMSAPTLRPTAVVCFRLASSLGGGDLPDPTDKSLTNLKASLDAGVASQDEYFPIGTKLPDFYAGNNSAWKVVHYGTATLGENSIVRDGVYLQQDFVYECVPLTSANYSQSNMISLLNSGQIYDKLSDEIKALVSEIKVPYTYSNTSHKISCQFFIPSATELGGEIASNVGDDGVMFDYYKQFISTPTNGIVTERIQRTESGVATDCWTRTSIVGNLVRMLTSSGSMSNNGAGPYYASIVCFIAKS